MLEDFANYIASETRQSSNYVSKTLIIPTTIELNGDNLCWDLSGETTKKTPERELIVPFSQLSNAEQILEFARTNGVLGLCQHNLPASHNLQPFLLSGERTVCQPIGREPVNLWLQYAEIARAILNIATRLEYSGHVKVADWLVLLAGNRKLLPLIISSERDYLGNSINLWLELAGIRPQYDGRDRQLNFAYPVSNTLFGELAIQLTLLIGKTEGIYTCSACGVFGTLEQIASLRNRKPKEGTRFYCDDCRFEGAAIKNAQTEYRRRKKTNT